MKVVALQLILIALITGCINTSLQSAKYKRQGLSASDNTDTSTTSTTPSFTASQQLYWFSSGNEIQGTITISQNTKTVAYLRGKRVHEFLSSFPKGPNGIATSDIANFNRNYCIVMSFDNELTKKQLRVRAVPIIQSNFSTGTIERLFRIDLAPELKSENQITCEGDLPILNKFGVTIGTSMAGTVDNAFIPFDICVGCQTITQATNITLYSENENISTGQNQPITILNKIPLFSLDLAGIGLRIDLNADRLSDGTECSNSSCTAKGFDCCLEGQCVNDGKERPNASTLSEYSQAINDTLTDPLKFLNWPTIYYVCPNVVRFPKEEEDNVDELLDAKQRFQTLLEQYLCLEEGKKEVPEYEANNVCVPTSETQTYFDRYLEVRKQVWKQCGCDAFPFPDKPEEPYCPDFGLKAIFSTSDVITAIECDIPNEPNEPQPFQDTKITLSSRTAPHRFFRKVDGVAVDDLTTIKDKTSVEQEGERYFYLDKRSLTSPQNDKWNINAVLGTMEVDLSSAVPAKVINVEFDQRYIIQTTNGFYTPCPTCRKDNWFDVFTAYPSSERGKGLQAVGFTTSREDNEGFNVTSGNYEDTIFGRACWVPPTMIAMSHMPNVSTVVQRQNRLATQFAYFANGYQRDWYGFNKGAVIGSFDGVSWFAIGTGRRVTSRSTKLFLAINQSFADLTDNTPLTVNVIQDLGNNVIADSDYNPSLQLNDSRQNSAGTCQSYHICSKDLDCVSKLGWEYLCEDITRIKTSWPIFDSNANEEADNELVSANFIDFLYNFQPLAGAKRCVYRGAGSPCKKNYKTGLVDSKATRLWSCAPNFYCADLDSLKFNNRVIREPNASLEYLFGQEANILGRPENYLLSTSSLPSEIKGNMAYNARYNTSNSDDWGICRPGRKMATTSDSDPNIESHKAQDTKLRTDFINQISNCDSSTVGADRVVNCPVFNTEPFKQGSTSEVNPQFGNYIFDYSPEVLKLKQQQNTCGFETRDLSGNSPFDEIEVNPLIFTSRIDQKSLAKDACLRRPGAVCHTNLECSPNHLHVEQALIFDSSYFGNTSAETQYWREELVCSQAQPKPGPSSEDFGNYDMTLNRCCREVNKTITMHTQYLRTSSDPALIKTQLDEDFKLVTSRLPQNGPTADGRYSRYAIVDLEDQADGTISSEPYNQAPRLNLDQNGYPLLARHYQWKTMNDTGKKTCCGGGMIRKFADGTHDWRITSRLTFNITNFACLNYHNDSPFDIPPNVSTNNYNKDYDKICLAPGEKKAPGEIGGVTKSNFGDADEGGCAQVPIEQGENFKIDFPSDLISSRRTAILDTTPDETPSTGSVTQYATLSSRVPFTPTPYALANFPYSKQTEHLNYIAAPQGPATIFYLPYYMGARTPGCNGATSNPTTCYQQIKKVSIRYMSEGEEVDTTPVIEATPTASSTGNTKCRDGLETDAILTAADKLVDDEEWYCIFRTQDGYDLMLVSGDKDKGEYAYAGIVIEFEVMGTSEDPNISALNGRAMNGGNDLYYLTKLGRLELLGIPQINYEPIYCNSQRDELVPGIFNTENNLRSEFQDPDFSFIWDLTLNRNDQGSNIRYPHTIYNEDEYFKVDASLASDGNYRASYQNKVNLPPVFSENEFICCQKLGATTTSDELCCSNYSIEEASTTTDPTAGGDAEAEVKRKCALPSGANLNVYFNRFVSTEGVGTSEPLGGLTDEDFIPETGEPKFTQAVYDKLTALGNKYCGGASNPAAGGSSSDSKVRNGAAFGNFLAEPNNGFYKQTAGQDESAIYSIIDSLKDQDTDNQSGAIEFLKGYRWNHHLYCQ